MDKIEFDALINGETVKLYVRQPNYDERRESQKIYNIAFNNGIKSKAILRAKLNDVMEEQGLWDKDKERKYQTLAEEIFRLEKTLKQGGIKLGEAREIALKIKELRGEVFTLTFKRIALDANTVERQAETEQLNYLISACTFYSADNKRYFSNLEDYINRSEESTSLQAYEKMFKLIYGTDDSMDSQLPENQFLKKYKFVDDKGRLIDKQGRLIDKSGRLINENGHYINEQGQRVDMDGNLLTEDGDFDIQTLPFLDDETGNPLAETV